jgi:hypothetical protein
MHWRPAKMRLPALIALWVFFAALLSRLLVAHLFATDLPYWDQWDCEGWLLLRPFQNGTLSWTALFAPHNEHRVLFTRLVTLTLFLLNSEQWDNLVSLTFNAFFFALFSSVAVYQIARHLNWRLYSPWFVFCALVAALPLPPENVVSGFQSQFYFLLAFTLSGIWIAATKRLSVARLVVLCALAACCVFTVASGLLSAPLVAGASWLRQWQDRRLCETSIEVRAGNAAAGRLNWILTAVCGLISVVAYWNMPTILGHMALRAQGLGEFFAAMTVALSWPFTGHWTCCGILVWIPFLIYAIRILLRRAAADSIDIAAVVSGAWVAVQTFAMAYARGHSMTSVPSRYVDILAIGLLVNLLLVIRLFGEIKTWRKSAAFLLAVVYVFCVGALGVRTAVALADLQQHGTLSRVEITHVRQFVATGDAAELRDKPLQHIPYPDASRLEMMLRDSTVRAMLPVSVRQSIALPRTQAFMTEGFFPGTVGEHFPNALGSYSRQIGDANEGELTSATLTSSFPYLGIDVAGYLGTSGLTLSFYPSAPFASPRLLQPETPPRESWVRLFTATPHGAFQLHALDARADSWLAFTEPVEFGRLSVGVFLILSNIWYLAAACLAALVFLSVFCWYEQLVHDPGANGRNVAC